MDHFGHLFYYEIDIFEHKAWLLSFIDGTSAMKDDKVFLLKKDKPAKEPKKKKVKFAFLVKTLE